MRVYTRPPYPTILAHGEYWRLLLAESAQPLELAAVREDTDPTPAFFVDATYPMFDTADTPGVTIGRDASNYYTTISHPARLGAYTDAQLAGTVAALHVSGNYAGFAKVASVAAGTLSLAPNTFRPSAGNGAYALLNVLPMLAQGKWGWRDNGDGTVTLFVWPNDPASLVGGIEISGRKEVLWVGRSGSATAKSLTLDGLGFEMASSTPTDYSSACVFLTADGALMTLPTVVKQCEIRRFGGGQGLFLQFLNNITCSDTTIGQGLGFGINCNPLANYGFNHRFQNMLAEDLSQTGYRLLGVRDSVLVDCKAVRTSGGGHANSLNIYQNSDRVAVVRFVGGYSPTQRLHAGYATNQQSSRLLFLNCVWPMARDGRAFVDQTGGSSPLPGPASGDYWMVNCWVPHEPALANRGGTPGVIVGTSFRALNWWVYNCVTPAISLGGASTVAVRKCNMLTKAGAVTADASETVADYATLFTDAAASNWSLKSGSALATKAGFDVDSVIAQWEALFPAIDFRKDIAGRTWNPRDPGVGPFGKAWAA